MIWLALLLVGSLIGQFYPDKFRVWVRGVAGKARGVFARKDKNSPAPAPALEASAPSTSSDGAKTAKPVQWSRALTNILGFFVRYWQPIVLVIIALVIISAFRGCSLPFDGKSKDALRLERELAEANTRLAQHETRLGELSRDLAVNTERDRTRRATVIAQAEREIEDATAQVDPDALYDAYVGGYLCLLDPGACSGSANPAPPRTPPVRGTGANPA